MKTYPEFEPAWVESDDAPATLRWLDADGKPAEEIGVAREGDVPGIHTPEALAKIHAMPHEHQVERAWKTPEAPAKPE